MMNQLKQLDTFTLSEPFHDFYVGYAKINLTPSQPTTTAGYIKRKNVLYNAVRDSIYVRSIVIDNGAQKIAIVSADLLIIPPTVTERLTSELASIGFSLNNTYLGATHTHNSIGNWGKGATRFIYGKYEDDIVEFIADQIIACIKLASENMVAANLRSGAIPIPQAVGNRMIQGGPEDSLLRVIEVHRSDSSKLVLMSYTAHATCLYSRDLELSRDYPGKLVDTLESQGYSFAMFMAGAVGSHKCTPQYGSECIDWMAGEISSTFLESRNALMEISDSTLGMISIPFPLSNPQVKIHPNWKVRSWLFHSALGEYNVYLNALRIGNVIMLGTPCDFSGEFNPQLDSVAGQKSFQTIVTSFNGGYIGYITPVNRYDLDYHETQIMNWYAPGTGEYMQYSLERLIGIIEK